MRTPVTVKIKFKCTTIDRFAERYAVDLSDAGIFIRTPKPLATGTHVSFEFQYQDGTPLLSGSGTVVWVREHEPAKSDSHPGMGVRFDQLPPESRAVLDQVLEHKRRMAPAAQPGAAHSLSPSEDTLRAVDLPTPAVQMPWAAAGALPPEFEALPTSQVSSHSALSRPAAGARSLGLGPSGTLPPPTMAAPASPAPAARPAEPSAPFQPFGTEGTPGLLPGLDGGALSSLPPMAPEFDSGAGAAPRDLGDLLGHTVAASPSAAAPQPQRLEDIVFGEQDHLGPPDGTVPDSTSGAGPLVQEPVVPSFAPRGSAGRRAARRRTTPPWLVAGLVVGVVAVAVLGYLALRPAPTAPAATTEVTNPTAATGATAAAAGSPGAPSASTPTPTPPPAAGVAMTIESTPAGARVIVDGRDTGKVTPTELSDLDPERELEIALDLRGKKLFRTKQKPTPRLPLTVDLSQSALRSIQVLSTPPGAAVFLDGSRIGETATLHALAPGPSDKPMELRISKRGFADIVNTIDPATANWQRDAENEVLKIDVVLSPKSGAVPAAIPAAVPDAAKAPVQRRVPRRPAPAATPAPPPPGDAPAPTPAAAPEPAPAPPPPPPPPAAAPEPKEPAIRSPSWGD